MAIARAGLSAPLSEQERERRREEEGEHSSFIPTKELSSLTQEQVGPWHYYSITSVNGKQCTAL